VLRDKDDNTAWTTACDGTLEQRTFYLNNWRGDVVGLVTSTGYQAESVRYSAYGTPFGYPGGDCDADGAADSADATVISGWISGSTYDVRGDLDLDGDVDSTDSTLFAASYSGTTTGRGVLSSGGNQVGYAGMLWFGNGQYLARNRWHDPELGRWGRRDPLGYSDRNGELYSYCVHSPLRNLDPLGLFSQVPGASGGLEDNPWDESGYTCHGCGADQANFQATELLSGSGVSAFAQWEYTDGLCGPHVTKHPATGPGWSEGGYTTWDFDDCEPWYGCGVAMLLNVDFGLVPLGPGVEPGTSADSQRPFVTTPRGPSNQVTWHLYSSCGNATSHYGTVGVFVGGKYFPLLAWSVNVICEPCSF